MFVFSIIRIVSSEGLHLIPAWPGPLTMLAKSKKNIWVNKWTQLSQMLFCRLALPEETGKGLRKSSGVGLWDGKNDSHENVSLWQDRWMVRLALWVETEENNEKGLPETNQPSSWFCVRQFPCWCSGSLGDLRSDVISAPLNLATYFDYCSGLQIEGWWRVILDLGKVQPLIGGEGVIGPVTQRTQSLFTWACSLAKGLGAIRRWSIERRGGPSCLFASSYQTPLWTRSNPSP